MFHSTYRLLLASFIFISSFLNASVELYQTSRDGDRLQAVDPLKSFSKTDHRISVDPEKRTKQLLDSAVLSPKRVHTP